tara:strand:- start:6011 stop:6964 length:954 start_codon:yes stop_codon:yes gene_type:complete
MASILLLPPSGLQHRQLIAWNDLIPGFDETDNTDAYSCRVGFERARHVLRVFPQRCFFWWNEQFGIATNSMECLSMLYAYADALGAITADYNDDSKARVRNLLRAAGAFTCVWKYTRKIPHAIPLLPLELDSRFQAPITEILVGDIVAAFVDHKLSTEERALRAWIVSKAYGSAQRQLLADPVFKTNRPIILAILTKFSIHAEMAACEVMACLHFEPAWNDLSEPDQAAARLYWNRLEKLQEELRTHPIMPEHDSPIKPTGEWQTTRDKMHRVVRHIPVLPTDKVANRLNALRTTKWFASLKTTRHWNAVLDDYRIF